MSTAFAYDVPVDGEDPLDTARRRLDLPELRESDVPEGWRPTPSKPVPVVRCTVVKKDGVRCNRWSIRGATVCVTHGGQLPVVQEHAKAVIESTRWRIIQDTDDAVTTMEALMQPGTADGIRLKAATEILDRAGIRGGTDNSLTVEVNTNQDPATLLRDRLEQMRERAATHADTIDGEIVVDAEEVPDDQGVLFEL